MGGIDVGVGRKEIVMEEKNKHQESIWGAIFFVVLLVIAIVVFIPPLIRQENAFPKIEGKIVTSRMDNYHYRITLSTSTVVFRGGSSHRDVLEEKAVRGSEATIWYDMLRPSRFAPYRRYIIRKMIVNDEIVIPFREGRLGIYVIGGILIVLFFVLRALSKRLREEKIKKEENK